MPTIDATKGGVNANSYLDVNTADILADGDYLIFDTWSAIDEITKARLLITATKQIDGLSIKYKKANDSQALQFPVYIDNSNDDGFESAQLACLYQAVFIYENAETLRELEADAIKGVVFKSIGSASEQYKRAMPNYIPTNVLKILSKYINLGVELRRG